MERLRWVVDKGWIYLQVIGLSSQALVLSVHLEDALFIPDAIRPSTGFDCYLVASTNVLVDTELRPKIVNQHLVGVDLVNHLWQGCPRYNNPVEVRVVAWVFNSQIEIRGYRTHSIE